jgi:CubicO group peptidase (beta-lactamase class C family)
MALVNDGQKIYFNAIGYKNLRTKDSLSTKTLIPLISVSKIFTKLEVAHSGVVLRKSAEDYIHDSITFQFPKRSFYQLLEHRSGLASRKSFLSRLFVQRRRSLDHWGIDYLEKLLFDDSLNYQEVYSDLNCIPPSKYIFRKLI